MPLHSPSPEEISDRARQIWEQAGRPEGCDLDHWLRAEKELRKERTQASEVEAGLATGRTPPESSFAPAGNRSSGTPRKGVSRRA